MDNYSSGNERNVIETVQEHQERQGRKHDLQEELQSRQKKLKRDYESRISQIEKEGDLEFEPADVESYLRDQGFERVYSVPWHLDITGGVSRRLQDNPTYWKEVKTEEGNHKGLIFRMNEDYELLRDGTGDRNRAVLRLDPSRDKERGLAYAAGFLGSVGGCLIFAAGIFSASAYFLAGGASAIGLSEGNALKIYSDWKKTPEIMSRGNQAVFEPHKEPSKEGQTTKTNPDSSNNQGAEQNE